MAEPVTHLPERRQLPEAITIDPAAGIPPHSPREMSLLAEMTGRQLDELAGEGADQGDRECLLVWFTLRRLGFEPTWEEARDQLVNYVLPNPLGDASSRTSPGSASTSA